jgi:hypothetical protein
LAAIHRKGALGLLISDGRGKGHGNIHYIRAITQHVSLHPGQFHVGVVFVTETHTPGTWKVRYREAEVAATAVTIELEPSSDVCREREVPGQRFQEGLVKRGRCGHFLAIGIRQDTGILRWSLNPLWIPWLSSRPPFR